MSNIKMYAIEMTRAEAALIVRAMEAFRPHGTISESDQLVNMIDYIEAEVGL